MKYHYPRKLSQILELLNVDWNNKIQSNLSQYRVNYTCLLEWPKLSYRRNDTCWLQFAITILITYTSFLRCYIAADTVISLSSEKWVSPNYNISHWRACHTSSSLLSYHLNDLSWTSKSFLSRLNENWILCYRPPPSY